MRLFDLKTNIFTDDSSHVYGHTAIYGPNFNAHPSGSFGTVKTVHFLYNFSIG